MAVENWKVVSRLAAGPWSNVYRCAPLDADASSGADYALKVVEYHVADQDQAHWMLANELDVASKVHHQNLVSVLEADLENETPYLIMPFLEGETLQDRLCREHFFATPSALWVVRQVAQALTAIHARNFVHRDVKTENVMVSQNAHVTLIDLGMALSVNQPQEALECFFGSVEYASPEMYVARSKTSPASDIYSLGVMLFELLAGRLPFWERSPKAIAVKHVKEKAPDVSKHQPNLPRGVARLVAKMLAKDPFRRPCAEELVDELIKYEIETFGEGKAA